MSDNGDFILQKVIHFEENIIDPSSDLEPRNNGTDFEIFGFDKNVIYPELYLTTNEKGDLKKAFNLLDYKGVGKINADEFRVAIKALGFEPSNEELHQLIVGVDKTESGKLAFEEFVTAIMRKVALPDSEEDLMKSFRLFDDDDTEFISYENLKNVCRTLDVYLTDEEMFEMIDALDSDFDNQVSVEEFLKFMKKAVPLVTP